jgi:hypothetical protein
LKKSAGKQGPEDAQFHLRSADLTKVGRYFEVLTSNGEILMSWLDRLLKRDGGKGGAPKRLPVNTMPGKGPRGGSEGTVIRANAARSTLSAQSHLDPLPVLPDFHDGASILQRRSGGDKTAFPPCLRCLGGVGRDRGVVLEG